MASKLASDLANEGRCVVGSKGAHGEVRRRRQRATERLRARVYCGRQRGMAKRAVRRLGWRRRDENGELDGVIRARPGMRGQLLAFAEKPRRLDQTAGRRQAGPKQVQRAMSLVERGRQSGAALSERVADDAGLVSRQDNNSLQADCEIIRFG